MANGLTRPDRADLEDLFDLDDPEDLEMLRELYELFLDEGISHIRQLMAMMNLGNLHEVDELAHSLKSTLGNVGLAASSEICNRIMENARAEDPGLAKEAVAHLGSLIPEMEIGVREFMRSL